MKLFKKGHNITCEDPLTVLRNSIVKPSEPGVLSFFSCFKACSCQLLPCNLFILGQIITTLLPIQQLQLNQKLLFCQPHIPKFSLVPLPHILHESFQFPSNTKLGRLVKLYPFHRSFIFSMQPSVVDQMFSKPTGSYAPHSSVNKKQKTCTHSSPLLSCWGCSALTCMYICIYIRHIFYVYLMISKK